jgi:LacI family transcriptional regulator
MPSPADLHGGVDPSGSLDVDTEGGDTLVGIRDVARMAGVSTATVTRVLRDSPKVTEETKALVQKTVSELGYTPNAMARALTSGRSNLIGLFVPDIANPFYASVAQGLEERAAEVDIHCVIASSHLNPQRERKFISALQDGTLAALAITTTGSDPDVLEALRKTKLPLVFIDRKPEGFAAPLVRTNNEVVTQEAVTHLIDLGHRRIAMLAGPMDFETASQRLSGFNAAMSAAAIPVDPLLISRGHLEESGGYSAMKEILALHDRPTAVFCFNNLITVGALAALREAGVTVPRDMSLLSFDDMSLFPYVDPPISAIAQPAQAMGRAAAEILLAQLRGESPPSRDVVLPARIISRASWGPVPAGLSLSGKK